MTQQRERRPTPRVSLRRLDLVDFRNYAALSAEFHSGHVVLTGQNGAGKTNLLEAISLLSPGRGLRRATLAEMRRVEGGAGFAVHATVEGPLGAVEIGTGTLGAPQGAETQRKVRINAAPAKSADDLLEWLRVMWITPAMDGLFTGPGGDRRRFLDRLVLTIDADHGRRALDYERAMRGRNRLLAEDRRDDGWLSAIEARMAETGVAMAAARAEIARLLRATIEALPDDSPFPNAILSLDGELEARLGDGVAAVDLEEEFRTGLARHRARDAAAGRAIDGPHRTDLAVRHAPKDMPAAVCSTGEQKALLVGLVLAHARLTAEIAGMAPILLLDEIAAHFDEGRRAALFDILDGLGGQAFMTGTERGLFSALEGRALFLAIADGGIVAT
ncbi:MAG: DNA replication/repair protein RecF [Rhizobiaceae bacterium]|nr:DNA replication/repair protein RecF [Rhizobiaceae bacterium]MCV0405039.1 DNA replication/repair protein RecF [Rhizobiaceae bacterium]